MKQLAQNIRKNSLTIEELPVPVCKAGGVLVKTVFHKDYESEFPLLQKLFRQKWFKEICFVKGDGRIYSIACASILAKVSRDRKMRELDSQFPQYQFSAHKGYGTELHVAKLREHGPCSEHRRSFAPVSQISLQF